MPKEWWISFIVGGIGTIVIIALTSGSLYYNQIVRKQLEKRRPEFRNEPKKQLKWWLLWTGLLLSCLVVDIIVFLLMSLNDINLEYDKDAAFAWVASLITLVPWGLALALVDVRESRR